jgi:hypothetical protein
VFNRYKPFQINRRPEVNLAKVTGKLKEQIHVFSGKLSLGLPKVARRFIEESIYGIQTKQSVHLSEIARALNDKVSLIKTINRLSRQLSRDNLWQKLSAALLKLAAKGVGDDTLLILDLSDITKPYAKGMEYLAQVYNGSDKTIGDGYWTVNVAACETKSSEVVPLYCRLHSQLAPNYLGENLEIERAVKMVSDAVSGRGIWVIDRGADRREMFDYFLTEKRRFIIRLKGDRNLLCKGKTILASEIAKRCSLPYTEVVIREEKSVEKRFDISFGFCQVKLPDNPVPLDMVVISGYGQEPIMLLTNLSLQKNRKVLSFAMESYITRWKIEETIRFIKQSYCLEDIRLLSYRRLQNMMALVLAVAFFATVYLGQKLKLESLSAIVMRLSKRIFGIPDFRYYAIAEGIKRLLERDDKGPERPQPPWSPRTQLSLLIT